MKRLFEVYTKDIKEAIRQHKNSNGFLVVEGNEKENILQLRSTVYNDNGNTHFEVVSDFHFIEIDTYFKFTLASDKLLKFIEKNKSVYIVFSREENTLFLSGTVNGSFKLDDIHQHAEALKPIEKVNSFAVNRKELDSLLYAVSKDNCRFNLYGIAVYLTEDKVNLVTTNGRVLTFIENVISPSVIYGKTLWLNANYVKHAVKLSSKKVDTFFITFEDAEDSYKTSIAFWQDKGINHKIIPYKEDKNDCFPRYKRIIPDRDRISTKITLSNDCLNSVLEKTKHCLSCTEKDQSSGIVVRVDENGLYFETYDDNLDYFFDVKNDKHVIEVDMLNNDSYGFLINMSFMCSILDILKKGDVTLNIYKKGEEHYYKDFKVYTCILEIEQSSTKFVVMSMTIDD